MKHVLKSYPEFFVATVIREKTHEVRQISNNLSVSGENHPFAVGDLLELNWFDPDTREYSGDVCWVRVTMVDPPKPWLDPDYVLMSIQLVRSNTTCNSSGRYAAPPVREVQGK